MDKKRLRMASESDGEKRQKLEFSDTIGSLEKRLHDNHAEVVVVALNYCKSILISKTAVETFVNSHNEQFSAVLYAFKRAALSETTSSSPWATVLKKASSILATCCYFSFLACSELAKPRRNIPQTLGRLLEMSETRVPLSTKASLLRLIKNMCQHKEIAASVIYFTLDSVVQFLTNIDRTVGSYALSIVRTLVDLNFASRVIAANGCKYIGDLLAREVAVEENISWKSQIVFILRRLAPNSASTARTVGRQLAVSDGGAALLSTFLNDECDEEFKDMVVEICTHSPSLREYFSDHEILEKVVAMNEPSTAMISILCAYTREAWSRERLLNVGALDVLLNRCCISPQITERFMIISSLVHFSHYLSGLVHIFRSAIFLKTVIADISNYLGKSGVKCKHKYNADEILPCTTMTMNHRVALRKMWYTTGNKDRVNGCYYGRGYSKTSKSPYRCSTSPGPIVSWSRSVSPPSNSASSFSGAAMSPPSATGSVSPRSVISPSSSLEDFFFSLFVDNNAEDGGDCEHMDVEEEKKEIGEADSEERLILQKMVSAELQLFSYPTSENNILGVLFREDIVDLLLRCCIEVSLNDIVPVKILLKMLEYRTMMDSLLNMQFHCRIFHILMTKKWDMEGHERALLNHCSSCSTLGCLLLNEFSQHVDSKFGLPILVDSLKAKTDGERVKASVAALYLVRSSAGHIRIYSKFDPLNILVEALLDILSGLSCNQKVHALAYENGPSLVYQILCSLSNVIDPDKICSLYHFKNEAYNFIMVGGQCIMLDDCKNNRDEFVVFKKETGEVVEKISKQKLIESSDYFKGMFANEFLEKASGCSTFVFSEDVEDCTEVEFKQFLHYLCGCRSEKCFRLDSSHSVVVMIKLSDRYLCNSMTDMLLAENGPAIYYMLKGNIKEFLSPLLFTGIGECERFEDAFFFHLLRFTTDEEVRLTLLPLVSNAVATEVFIGKLIRFLKRHIILDVYLSDQLLRRCEKINAQ